jgi:hypothetical protein
MPILELTADHRYRLDGQSIPGVSEVLESNGLISSFAKVPEAARRGTLVHECMALYGLGYLDWLSVDPRILGYVLSGVQFYDSLEFKPAFLERKEYHRDYFFAGTIDAIGGSRMGDLLVDWKTGKASEPAARLQLAAYKALAERLCGGKFRTVVVELDERGGKPNLKFLGNERADFAQFVACLTVHRLKKG